MTKKKTYARSVKSRLAGDLGMNGFQFDQWKETVQMDSIQINHHAHHWVSNISDKLIR